MTAHEQTIGGQPIIPASLLDQVDRSYEARIQLLTAQLQAAQATITEALSYFGNGETAYIAKVLRRADTSALAAVKAKTLREAADYLAEPYRLWHGDFGVTVTEYDGQPSVRQLKLVDWLRARAASIEQEGAE